MNDSNLLLTNDSIDKFLERISFSGLLALYAFHHSYTSKKAFSFETLVKKVDFLPEPYGMAFLIVSQSLGLIDYTSNKHTDSSFYNITYYNSYLASKIKAEVYDRASVNELNLKNTTETTLKLWKQRAEYVEQYFN